MRYTPPNPERRAAKKQLRAIRQLVAREGDSPRAQRRTLAYRPKMVN